MGFVLTGERSERWACSGRRVELSERVERLECTVEKVSFLAWHSDRAVDC